MGLDLTGNAGAGRYAFPVFASASEAPLSIVAQSNGDTGILLMSGSIGSEGLGEADIIAELTKLKAEHENVTVHLRNFMGGAVTDGALIYNEFEAAGVDTIAEGIVASFGTVLFAAGKNRKVVRFSKLMIHNGRAGAAGTADELRAQADFIDTWNDDMAGVFAKVLNTDLDAVKAKYFDGKDHWITANAAVKMGLATEEVKGMLKKAAPSAKHSNVLDVAAFYQTQLQDKTETEIEMKNKQKFIAVLAVMNPALTINAESSEDAILAEVTAQANILKTVTAERDELKTKFEKAEGDKVVALVDAAIEAGKITKAQKEQFETLGKADYDNTKAVLDGLTGHEPISGKLGAGGKGGPIANADAFANMPFAEIVKAEGGSKYLDALQKTDEKAYDELKAAYSVLPG